MPHFKSNVMLTKDIGLSGLAVSADKNWITLSTITSRSFNRVFSITVYTKILEIYVFNTFYIFIYKGHNWLVTTCRVFVCKCFWLLCCGF